jgi:hypothetical protein
VKCEKEGCEESAVEGSSYCAEHAKERKPKASWREYLEYFYGSIFAVSSLVVLVLGGWSESVFLDHFDIAFAQYADINDYIRVALKNFLHILIIILFSIIVIVSSMLFVLSTAIFSAFIY